MPIEEEGTVVEVRGHTALVRLRRSSSCSGCASAGHCRQGSGEHERLLETRNEVGAAAGDAVRVTVSAGALLAAPAKAYLLPVVGLLIGAAAAQVLARACISSQAGDGAAGIGGIAGAVLAWVIGRRWGGRVGSGAAALPRITRIEGRLVKST